MEIIKPEDFNKQKIVYPDIMGLPKNSKDLNQYPYFYFDKKKFFIEATNFIMTGKDIELIFPFLVSDLGFYIYTKFYSGPQLGDKGFRYKKEYLLEMYFINSEIIEKIKNSILDGDFSESSRNHPYDTQIEKFYADFLHLTEEERSQIYNYKTELISL